MDISAFRKEFTEFTDTTKYPSPLITLWATVAEQMVDSCRWKGMYTTGVKLYVAHEISIAVQDIKTAKVGGAPGTSGGIANTKTVGSATIGFDSQATTEKNAGWWNRTTYGQQFYRLSRIFGAGSVQL